VEFLNPSDKMAKTVLLLGCDPAFQFLDAHVSRIVPEASVHCHFASSHRALSGLAAGFAHLAGTHLHNTGKDESNVLLAGQMLLGAGVNVIGFSLLEEGLMVAKGNPLGIRGVVDLSSPDIRLVNREPGAALRVLLDDHLKRAGIPASAVNGYHNEVHSHIEGALRVFCHAADAALGLRAIAATFDLDFVDITAVRCDLVIPGDLMDHPTVRVVLDVLQSAALKKEVNSVPGYDAAVTGKQIATL
jgi:putative molybdopterin biosynthesis protein